MDVDHALFLVVAISTHGIVGYAFVRTFTDVDPRVGFLLAIVPDVDFVLGPVLGGPFVHRGITHTPLFAVSVIAIAYAVRRRRRDVIAAALALGSHLAIDSLSPAGIMWLYPFGGRVTPGLSVHGPSSTLLLWTVAGVVVLWGHGWRWTGRDASR